jgi:hypothetical protein
MALPDDDGTQAAEVARFKRKRRFKLGAFAVLALLGLVVATVLVASLFQTTSFDEELQLIRKCKMDPLAVNYDTQGRVVGNSKLSKPCRRVMYRLLRRLAKNRMLCERIADQIAAERDWDQKNRLLRVLLLHRRALYPIEQPTTKQELRRHRCVEEPVVQLIQQWSKTPTEHANPKALVPGLARYNSVYLLQTPFLVINAYVLKRTRTLLPMAAARRFAAHVLKQFRKLSDGSRGDAQKAVKWVFNEVFYPVWVELGRPEP